MMIDELWSNYKIFESPLGITSPPYFEHTLTFAPNKKGWISKFVIKINLLKVRTKSVMLV